MRERGWLEKLQPIAVALAALGAAVVLATFNPSEHPFPKCPFHWVTGLYCPGCGSQRAIHNLLNGSILLAARFNLFVVVSLPILLLGYLRWSLDAYDCRWRLRWRAPARWIWAFLAAMLIYTLLRNLPFYPFALLAPPVNV